MAVENFNPNRSKKKVSKSNNDQSSNFLNISSTIEKPSNNSNNNSWSRLQELEKDNAHLKNLIEKQSRETAGIVLKNNKSISIIAHDLRSPFNSILGALQILKGKYKSNNNNEIDKFIAIAIDSANKTLNLLDVLLEWTISRNVEKKIASVAINLSELLTEEIENNFAVAKLKQIRLNQQIAANVNVFADLQMVKTIFRNLLGNAIKYSNSGEEITISASENDQLIEICVKDNGIGISTEAQKELFKVDEFNSTAGTNNELGTGLGLLLCKEFVEQLGGGIRVKSEPEKGSEFIFTLPIYAQ